MRSFLYKRKIIYIILIVVGVITVTGTTYAIFTTSASQEGTNTIETLKCLELEFSNQKNVINLSNTYPMLDERGMKNTPYTFTLTNKCGTYVEYSIGLAINKDNTLEDKYVKTIFSLASDTGEPVLLTDRVAGEVYNNKKTYIFRNDGLENNASKDYKLVLWIDESATKNQKGQSFIGNIIINTKPIKNEGQKTITVDLDGGNLLQELNEIYREGMKIKLPIPAKAGYHFTKWEVTSGDATLDENNYLTIGKENVSLKAYYQGGITLTLELNGGSTTQTFKEMYGGGEKITLIEPTKEGSKFAGWEITSGNGSLDGNILTINTESVVIEALWQQTWNFDFTGSEQTFTVPYTGVYKLETWGAQGGSYNQTYIGGYGGYSKGEVYLNKNDVLNIYVGGAATSATGGYNGGGTGDTSVGNSGGGGATHIATKSGLLNTLENNKDNILIVSGGGGGSFYEEGTGGAIGGSGGGYIGNNGLYNSRSLPTGGTQTAGGTCADSESISGSFGQGGSYIGYSTGGGGGFYGGAAGGIDRANVGDYGTGGGGSGYIGNSKLNNKVMYCYNCTESSTESTKTISTTCTSSTSTSNCAKQGNGYTKITFIGTKDYAVSDAEFEYTGSGAVFLAQKSGTYQLETWGAQGGSYNQTYIGGYGGYSKGEVYLNKNDVLNIYVGGTATSATGGYNGGGTGDTLVGNSGGGGATHIATKSGLLSTLENNKDSILIVAGGGGGSYYEEGTGGAIGGSGGGYIGNNGLYNGRNLPTGGTQTAGGTCVDSESIGGSFGQGGSYIGYSTGGGGGFYGGAAGGIDRANVGDYGTGGGGSGYIGNSKLSNKVMYCFNCASSSSISTKTISTTCANVVAASNCAKQGNGYAKITFVSTN